MSHHNALVSDHKGPHSYLFHQCTACWWCIESWQAACKQFWDEPERAPHEQVGCGISICLCCAINHFQPVFFVFLYHAWVNSQVLKELKRRTINSLPPKRPWKGLDYSWTYLFRGYSSGSCHMAAEMVTVVSSVNASLILICFNKTALLGFGSYLCHSVTDIRKHLCCCFVGFVLFTHSVHFLFIFTFTWQHLQKRYRDGRS